ncbi:hypothetical protein SLS57_010824 [Botryosphaeria dothidea]
MQDINRKPSLKERTETWLSSDKPEYLLDATSTREELAGELEAWLRRRFDFNHRFLAHWRALGVGETVVEILKRVCREGGYRDEEERARIAKLAREIHLRTYNEFWPLTAESTALDAEAYFLRESLAYLHNVRWVPRLERPVHNATAVMRALGYNFIHYDNVERQDGEFVRADGSWRRLLCEIDAVMPEVPWKLLGE